jgi:hypothetical protein
MTNSLVKSSSSARRAWGVLGHLTTWVVAQISMFLLPPPVTNAKVWVNFGRFCVAIVLGLTIVILRFHPIRRAVRRWWIATATLVLLGCATFVTYQWLLDTHVMPYAGTQVIIGTRTSDADTYRDSYAKDHHHWLTDAEVLAHYGGNVNAVWTTKSVEGTRMLLTLLFVATTVLLSLAVILVIQLLFVKPTCMEERNHHLPASKG